MVSPPVEQEVDGVGRIRRTRWLLVVLFAAWTAQLVGKQIIDPTLSGFVGAAVMVPVAHLVGRVRTAPHTLGEATVAVEVDVFLAVESVFVERCAEPTVGVGRIATCGFPEAGIRRFKLHRGLHCAVG